MPTVKLGRNGQIEIPRAVMKRLALTGDESTRAAVARRLAAATL